MTAGHDSTRPLGPGRSGPGLRAGYGAPGDPEFLDAAAEPTQEMPSGPGPGPSPSPTGEAVAATFTDAIRFAVGTLTRIPVPAPRIVDRRVCGWGLALAPVVGVALALASALPLLAGRPDLLNRLLTATLTVGLLAWLTRGLHWDGLADFADGLGSRRPPAGALAVMRASDIGPFATLTLMFTAAVQVLGLALLPTGGPDLAGWVAAQVSARIALGVGAMGWVHPARPDGLGAAVIGSVRRGPALFLLATGTAIVLGSCAIGGLPPLLGLACVAGAAAISVAVARVAAHRFGGSTGDVLGATVELTATAVLLLAVLRP